VTARGRVDLCRMMTFRFEDGAGGGSLRRAATSLGIAPQGVPDGLVLLGFLAAPPHQHQAASDQKERDPSGDEEARPF
jgi:hypothetical protein